MQMIQDIDVDKAEEVTTEIVIETAKVFCDKLIEDEVIRGRISSLSLEI